MSLPAEGNQGVAGVTAPVGISVGGSSSTAKWLVGWLGTWFVLSLLAEGRATSDLASALAISVALAASFILLPDVKTHLAKGL